MTNFQQIKFSKVASVFLVIFLAVAIRTYDFKSTSLDYDEHKTIAEELRLTNGDYLLGYLRLKNVWNYASLNKEQLATNNNISFPLYYIPMKAVYLLRSDLASLRLATITWGILSILFLFLLGNLFGKHVGWIAFVIMLFHPWAQHHATHIRFYEFWAFISVIGVYYTKILIEKVRNGSCGLLNCFMFAVLLLLPCTVHAFGIVNVLFLSGYVALKLWRADEVSIESLKRPEWIVATVVFLLMGIIVAGNMGAFGYAALIDGQAEDWNNSSSLLQIWGSFVFNAGYLLPLIAMAGILVILISGDSHEHRELSDIALAVALSLIPVVIITAIKPNAIRSDFIYGMFPYVILIAALSINALGNMAFQGKYALATKGFLVAIIITSTLPTFVSNVFIDKDRLPHDRAAAMIDSFPEIKAYAPNPNYFNFYLTGRRVDDIRKANRRKNESGVDEYFFIPVRKGMSTQYFYDFYLIDGLKLIKILGKDRLDLRSNHIYIFVRKHLTTDPNDASKICGLD